MAVIKTSDQITRPGRGWLTKKQMADALDVTPRCFDRDYRRYVDPAAEKKVGLALFFHARSVLDKWKSGGGRGAAQVNGESDPLLQGPPTEWLEEYRKQRALQEEIKLEQMRGNTVAIADIEPQLMALCGVMRRAGETLTRRFGNEAGQVVNEAVDEWESGLGSVIMAKGDKGESDGAV